MQRQMALDTILIVDGLNYIKGFRYQMYCAAREMKLRVCTVRHPLNIPFLVFWIDSIAIDLCCGDARTLQGMEWKEGGWSCVQARNVCDSSSDGHAQLN
jgi:hypothetical protein